MEKPLPTYIDHVNRNFDPLDSKPYIVKYLEAKAKQLEAEVRQLKAEAEQLEAEGRRLEAKAKQLEAESKQFDEKWMTSGDMLNPSNIYHQLATLAFNYTQALSRLNAMHASIDANNSRRIAAQEGEVAGWDVKAKRFLTTPSRESLYNGMVSDFSQMAVESNLPDKEEQRIINLGNAGRIGEVHTTAVVHTYAHEDSSTRYDSTFN